MKSKLHSSPIRSANCLSSGFAIAFLAISFAQGAALTWDTVPGDGAAITDGAGAWSLAAGNWNDAGADVLWSQSSATVASNSAIFGGGTDGTYAIAVGEALAAQGITFNNSGYTLSAASAQTITSSGTTATSAMTVAAGKTATIGSNVTVTKTDGNFNMNGADGVASGTLNISSGGKVSTTTVARRLEVRGDGAVVNVFGTMETTVNNSTAAWIGIGGSSGTATVNVETGGVVQTAGGQIRVGFATGTGTGILSVNGGTVTANNTLFIGNGSGTTGILTLNSGLVDTSATTFTIGQSSATGTVNLNGGTLFVKNVGFAGSGLDVFKFDGGELKAAAGGAFFGGGGIAGSGTHVHNGGAKFNSNGFDITVGAKLIHSALAGAAAIDGGLTKTGTGTLILTNSNTYNGATLVSAGTLLVNGALGNTAVTVGNSATLGGTNGTIGTGTASVTVNSGGTLAPGSSIGSMTVNGSVNLTLGSAFAYELMGGGVTADLVDVNGELTIDGASLSLSQSGGSYTPNDRFTLFAYDTLGAGFTGFAGLPENSQFTQAGGVWQINYADPSPGLNGGVGSSYVTITAIPETSTAALAGLAIGFGLIRRRRSAARASSL